MRTVLICHAGDAFDRRGLASWLAWFSTLAGVVVLEETGIQKRQRYLREFRRVGLLGMLDVAAMMHPGICPECRNAHGCFWAMAERDLGRVGMTLLRIDAGIDTGQVFGHYRYDFDERRESHAVIQARVVPENLDPLAVRFAQVHAGTATPVDTAGRRSGQWGQRRLSRHLRVRRAMRVAEVNG